MQAGRLRFLKALIYLVIGLNIMTWFYARDLQARWLNVPKAPGVTGATAITLGDRQFAYRVNALMLQNLGETGGRSTAFEDYNYEELAQWFLLQDRLDSRSNFTPFLAAFYFGAVQDPEKLPPLIEYLRRAGHQKGKKKWRWLAQAVYLARFQMQDLDLALALSKELAALDADDMPHWARRMPVFVLNAKGDKEEAYAMMLEILRDTAGQVHPNEANFTREYICTRILDEGQAIENPLCQGK